MAIKPWEDALAREIIAAHARDDGAALQILHALHHQFGHVPHTAIPLIAIVLNRSQAEIHGVISFYPDFRETPPGRHVLKLCRAEACQAMGCEALHSEARTKLGIDWGETTQDRRMTLETVYCLGLCATAPAAQIDGKPIGRLTKSRLLTAIETAR